MWAVWAGVTAMIAMIPAVIRLASGTKSVGHAVGWAFSLLPATPNRDNYLVEQFVS